MPINGQRSVVGYISRPIAVFDAIFGKIVRSHKMHQIWSVYLVSEESATYQLRCNKLNLKYFSLIKKSILKELYSFMDSKCGDKRHVPNKLPSVVEEGGLFKHAWNMNLSFTPEINESSRGTLLRGLKAIHYYSKLVYKILNRDQGL